MGRLHHVQTGQNPAQANEIFLDSALSAELGAEARRLANPPPRGLVFHANSQQELVQLLNVLGVLKRQATTNPTAATPLPTLTQQGFVTGAGQQAMATAAFIQRVKAQPAVEIIFSLGDDHHAVISMDANGLAYIDSKGAAIPENLIKPQGQQQPILPPLWLTLYDKPQTDQAATQQLLQRSFHLKKDIKQQPDDDKHSGIDWCLANLAVLSGNVNAPLDNVSKADRNAFLPAVNRRRTPQNQLQLNLQEKKDAAANRETDTMVQVINARSNHFHQHSSRLFQQAQEAGVAEFDRFQQQPAHGWMMEFRRSSAPQYKKLEPNKYEVMQAGNPVPTRLEVKQDVTECRIKQDKSMTEYEAFLQMAKAMLPALVDEHGNLPPGPVRIKNIKGDEAACRRAFEVIFHENGVQIVGPQQPVHGFQGVQAQPLIPGA